MDGANFEIREETVEDNMLTLRLLTPEIDSARSKMKYGEYKVHGDCLSEAIVKSGITCIVVRTLQGQFLSRNSINLLSSRLVMYSRWKKILEYPNLQFTKLCQNLPKFIDNKGLCPVQA